MLLLRGNIAFLLMVEVELDKGPEFKRMGEEQRNPVRDGHWEVVGGWE